MQTTVVLTDHPWPDLEIERGIFAEAGFRLVTGGIEAPPPEAIETLVRDNNPSAIITCWAVVSAAAIRSPDDLRVVTRLGVGLDNIAVDAATQRGTWVTNVPDYCVSEVSDHAAALTLAALRDVVRLDRDVKRSGWHVPSGAAQRLSTLTVGIIGFGRIGRETARKLLAFGCRVLAVRANGPVKVPDVETATIAMIQAEADVIILHAPLTEATNGMIDDAFVARCAARPLIVNVSRGGLVDNDALIRGLNAGRLRGAALDVIAGEPNPPLALLDRDDVIVTPHVAYSSAQSLDELRRRACEEVVRVLRGEPPLQPCNQPREIDRGARETGTALPGGVSSDISLAEGADGPIVIKQALSKLKVEADWFANPARAQTEARALRAAGALLGLNHVPEVLWERPEEHRFAMRQVDPRLRNWKQDLLAGRVDQRTAHEVGRLLGLLHACSQKSEDLAREFDDRTHFHELRVRPFFERVGEKYPDLAEPIAAVVRGMEARRGALVHGDYSPKNLLVDAADVVMLDFEVAHWGDPRFDVAFCLSHLFLKAARVGAERGALLGAALAILDGYTAGGGPDVDGPDLVGLLGCLLLARTDGDSPPDYLSDVDVQSVRAIGRNMLLHPASSVRPLLDAGVDPSAAPLPQAHVAG